MKAMKVTAIVEKAGDGGFACYVEEELDGFGLAGYGDTAAEAIEDMLVTYDEIKELRGEMELVTPVLEFSYKYDMASFFNYFPYLNISKIGEMAGINSSLMRQYASGHCKPGAKQYAKLRDAIQKVSHQLGTATF